MNRTFITLICLTLIMASVDAHARKIIDDPLVDPVPDPQFVHPLDPIGGALAWVCKEIDSITPIGSPEYHSSTPRVYRWEGYSCIGRWTETTRQRVDIVYKCTLGGVDVGKTPPIRSWEYDSEPKKDTPYVSENVNTRGPRLTGSPFGLPIFNRRCVMQEKTTYSCPLCSSVQTTAWTDTKELPLALSLIHI